MASGKVKMISNWMCLIQKERSDLLYTTLSVAGLVSEKERNDVIASRYCPKIESKYCSTPSVESYRYFKLTCQRRCHVMTSKRADTASRTDRNYLVTWSHPRTHACMHALPLPASGGYRSEYIILQAPTLPSASVTVSSIETGY